ncbi:hypothetical protein PF003_g30816 [Phytophthora fragariae]|nr:hypothetical protein PF003_g30816 [Phytophthora fragariae]
MLSTEVQPSTLAKSRAEAVHAADDRVATCVTAP